MTHLNAIALTAISSFKHLSQLHAQIIHYSLHHHNYWISLLITHCTRLRAPPLYARLIFDSVHQPNVYVYTNMLKFYSQLGADNDVITLFHSMQVSRIIPDAFVYPILIKSCGRIAVELHCHVLKMGHECDCYVRNAVMDMYARYGFVEFARKVFDEMSDRKVADWNSIISGYWRNGNDIEAQSQVLKERTEYHHFYGNIGSE